MSFDGKSRETGEVIDVATMELAQRMADVVGYPKPELIAIPLKIIEGAMKMQAYDLQTWDGEKVEDGDLVSFLNRQKIPRGKLSVDMKCRNMKGLMYPKDNKSFWGRVINELSRTDSGLNPEFDFDLVNSKAVEVLLGDVSVKELLTPRRLFHRFYSEINGEYSERPRRGVPRVVMTNDYLSQTGHISVAIDVPDDDGFYRRVVDLFVGSDKYEEWTSGKKRLEEFRGVEFKKNGMSSLAVEAARLALMKGFYPFGAVIESLETGHIIVARNNTSKHKETDQHAEYLALKLCDRSDDYQILHSFADPCISCYQRIEATPSIRGVNMVLGQTAAWSGKAQLSASARARGAEPVNSNEVWWDSMKPAIKLLEEANAPEGRFPGEFDQMIALNRNRYNDEVTRIANFWGRDASNRDREWIERLEANRRM